MRPAPGERSVQDREEVRLEEDLLVGLGFEKFGDGRDMETRGKDVHLSIGAVSASLRGSGAGVASFYSRGRSRPGPRGPGVPWHQPEVSPKS